MAQLHELLLPGLVIASEPVLNARIEKIGYYDETIPDWVLVYDVYAGGFLGAPTLPIDFELTLAVWWQTLPVSDRPVAGTVTCGIKFPGAASYASIGCASNCAPITVPPGGSTAFAVVFTSVILDIPGAYDARFVLDGVAA